MLFAVATILALAQMIPATLFVLLCLVISFAAVMVLWLACQAWAIHRAGFDKQGPR